MGKLLYWELFNTPDGTNLSMEFVETLMNPRGKVTRELATRVWDEFSSVDLESAQSIATAFIESEDDASLASNWLEVLG